VHPVLLHTDWVRLPTYFTCLMIGFSLASFVLRREALRRGLPAREVIDLALWVVPLALIGSRVAHVLWVDPTTWRTHPLTLVTGGGFVFYGGAIGGLVAIAGWSWRTGRSPWIYGDCLAPATAFGLAWGRLGCLGGGCCFGKPIAWPFGVELPWGIRYTRPGPVPDALLGVPLHPAPLYASLCALGLFVVLSRLAERQRFDGQITAAFLVLYGLVRIGLEALRNDVTRGMYFGGWVSTSQLVSVVAIAAGIGLWRWRRVPTAG